MIHRIEAFTRALRDGDDDVPDLDALLAEIGSTPADELAPQAAALLAALAELERTVAARREQLAAELALAGRRRAAADGFGYLEPRKRHRMHSRA